MTTTAETPTQSSPWLTAWIAPRETIRRIIATNPRRQILLLAALLGIANLLSMLIDAGPGFVSVTWSQLALAVVPGILAGLLLFYVWGFVLRLSSRLFGGRASQAEIRAAVAWSTLPHLITIAALVGASILWMLEPGFVAPRDLTLILQAILLVPAVWSWVLLVGMLAAANGFGILRGVLSTVVGAIGILFVAVLIRILAFQPFSIPSGSMTPTLQIGDYFFASKYSYGYSRYALPFGPDLFAGRILAAAPERGDVVVFQLPRDDRTTYVSRVVGLPGDKIQMINGLLHINGTPVTREALPDFGHDEDGRAKQIKRWRETLPNGVSHETLDQQENGYYDNTPVHTVPPGHYFMMSDNRDNATDSRVMNQVGFIPFENLVGRAQITFLSVSRGEDGNALRLGRIGRLVR